MVFEKHAKNGEKNIYHHYFLFFVIFSKSPKQKCLIPAESCFLDGKNPNIAKLVDINFLADKEKNRQAIGFAKWKGKLVFFCNCYKNVIIWVFLHAEFISALKTEPNLRFSRNMQKMKKKIYIIIIFYFL